MSLNSVKGEFIRELMQSKEYINLKNAKLTLSQNPDHSGEILRLHKIQEQLYAQRVNNEDTKAVAENLNKEYERLSAIPEINRYLQAVTAMNMLMNRIMSEINMSIDSSLR